MRIALFLTPKVGRRVRILLILGLVLVVILFLRFFLVPNRSVAMSGLPLSGKTIVLDPGHGGYDPGVYRNQVEEKIIVLGISVALRDYLQSSGVQVVMTRETDRDLLVVPTAGPKKKQDMKNRLNIIKNAQPDLVISIHANAISASRWRGAQVFYREDHEHSKKLALLVQQELARVLANTDRQATTGDYLILNESEVPAVLVETGFISNPEEARLLGDSQYQSKVAWAIYVAIGKYLATNS